MRDDKLDQLEAALAAHVRSRRGPEPPPMFAADVLRQVRAADLERNVEDILSRAFAPFLTLAAAAALVLVVVALRDHAWTDILFFTNFNFTGQSSPALWFNG